jgi:peroxiredoxin Q/BCP
VLAPGDPAPDFTLPDQEGNTVSLAELRGRWVVFWWFPKAFTEG